MALMEIVLDRLWHARQLVRVGPLKVFTRMTVVKLSDGSLWIHSPIKPEADIIEALAALGLVRHVVAPNNGHHLFFSDFLQAFPEAQGYVSPSLATKLPQLAKVARVGPIADCWTADLQGVFIEGLPQIDETVWLHKATDTLIVTDLLSCIAANQSVVVRMIARLLGIYRRLAMSRTLRALIRDKAAFARSIATVRTLDVRRVIVAHEEIVEVDAARQLKSAFDWI